jgi:hypothetical protein
VDVDALVVGAVQRILRSPDSGIKLGNVDEIRIFKATSAGAVASDAHGNPLVNTWTPGSGPDIDPGSGTERLLFVPPVSPAWPACTRVNSGMPSLIDSIGVTVVYRYEFVMPLASVVNAIAGGRANVRLEETTVMALNPTI